MVHESTALSGRAKRCCRRVSTVARASPEASRSTIILALLAAYILGGSNYAAIDLALEGFGPFTMLALRFLFAGTVLYLLTKIWSEAGARERGLWADVLLGLVLLGGTFGGIALAQTRLDSGLVAIVLATAPVWAMAAGPLYGDWPMRREWLGVALSLLGITALLGFDAAPSDPLGVVFALGAALSLAAGSAATRRMAPAPPFRAAAIQMLSAGTAFAVAAFLSGESGFLPLTPGPSMALLHQSLMCSVVSFTAFVFLLSHTRNAVAMSFVYVNPIVALALGALLLDEGIGVNAVAATGMTLLGVGLIISKPEETNLE